MQYVIWRVKARAATGSPPLATLGLLLGLAGLIGLAAGIGWAAPAAAVVPDEPQTTEAGGTTQVEESRSEVELPPGLPTFLKARMLESAGQYREALELYDTSLKAAPEETEIRVAYASLLVTVGQVEQAVELLDEADELDWYGLRTRALSLARLVNQQPERLNEAEQAIRKALDGRPDDSNLELALAQVVHRLGRLDEAEAIIADLRQKRVDNMQLVSYHAALLRGLGRLDEAEALYRKCAGSTLRGDQCNEALVQILIDEDRPAEAGEVMLGLADDDDLDNMLRAAGMLAEGGRDAEALVAVRKVLAAEPGSPAAQTLEAMLLSNLGRTAEATARLHHLLDSRPDDIDLLLPLAWAEAQGGHLDQARELIERAWRLLESDPSSEQAVRCCLAAARIELAADRDLVAREWLERVGDPQTGGVDLVRMMAATFRRQAAWQAGMATMLRLQPRLKGRARTEAVAFECEMRLRGGDSKGLQRLRTLVQSRDLESVLIGLQMLQSLQRWDETIRAADEALGRFPAQRDLLFARAAALERSGAFEKAVAAFEELLTLTPNDPTASNYFGYMLAQRGQDLDRAYALIRLAVDAEPTNPAYLDSLGWVCFKRGELDQAELWLRRAATLDTSDGTLLAHLGEVLLAKGTAEEATRLLRQALDIGCEDADRVRSLLDGGGQSP